MGGRKPKWIREKLPCTERGMSVRDNIEKHNLNTICKEARCPNRGECWDKGTATFLILGNVCTRDCKYCNVKPGAPSEVDNKEVDNVIGSIKKLGLSYAVVTSVTRDDLKDGGASVFADLVKKARKEVPDVKVELLVPDFRGDKKALKKVVDAKPHVLGHNMEVARGIFDKIRPQGDYERSLKLLKEVKKLNPKQLTKSGMMVGLGEDEEDIVKTMHDLAQAKVDIITIGQYLQPSKDHPKVKKFYKPDDFEAFELMGRYLNFKKTFSGPLVRSSYHAEEVAK